MASIFLSYSREDAAKAKALAKCLERAGHTVWWDRNIQGGSEYADEIEAALGEAAAIVVLWSEASSHSAWVRDEAAEGRDSGRLVPLLLDSSPPPLGFRQLQSISIAGWSGRGNPPEFGSIKAALARLGARSEAHSEAAAAAGAGAKPSRRALAAALAAVALVIAAAAGFFLLRGAPAKAEPTIAVLPFADLSPGRDKAFLAEGVAEAILTVLAKEPGIKVIGRSSAGQLHAAGSASADMRKAMGITHVLEGSARSIGDQLRMSVRLVDADDGRQLWAEEYDRKLDNIFAVQDEIGRAVAQKLRGSIGRTAAALTAPSTNIDVYSLYLAARAKMRDRKTQSLNEALALAKRAIASDPKYAPGHAVYAELLWHLSEDSYGNLPHEKAVAAAKHHARRAIALAPDAPEGYAALGLVSAYDSGSRELASKALKKAIRLDPARAELRLWLAAEQNSVGHHEDALRQLQATVELEPLWGTGVSNLAYVLAASDRHQDAEQVIAKFEQRGGSSAVAARIRADNAGYRGDFSEALRYAFVARARDPGTPLVNRTLTWNYGVLGFKEQTVAAVRGAPRFVELYWKADLDRLTAEARATGAAMWKRPDVVAAIDGIAFKRDFALITELYDANPKRAEICNDYRQSYLPIQVAAALQQVGRIQESSSLLDCVRQTLRVETATQIRSPYLPMNGLELMRAQLHALEGRPALAFAALDRSIALGGRTVFGRGLSEFPAFDAYRAEPAYRRADARLKQLIAAERAEAIKVLQAQSSAGSASRRS